MAAELQRRVNAGEHLEVRGIRVEVDALAEALKRHRGEDTASTALPAATAPITTAEAAPAPVAAAPASMVVASTTKTPNSSLAVPGGTTGRAKRWTPGPASNSLLASRAMMECEKAEAFARAVQVAEGAKIAIFTKPDVLTEHSGEYLNEGEAVEVVARYVCQKDGRVYLRLKRDKPAWVTTRSRKNLLKIVLIDLQVAEGGGGLEPAKCAEPLISAAAKLLPEMDPSTLSPSGGPVVAPDMQTVEDAELGEDVFDEGDDGDEGGEEESGDCDEEGDGDEEFEGENEIDGDEEELSASQAAEAAAAEEQESGGTAEASGQAEQVTEALGASTEEAVGIQATVEGGNGTATTPHVPVKKPRKFRVVAGRCPVISTPNAAELMSNGPKVMLNMKQEFWADGVAVIAAEGRSYLHLRNGRGWVCERSRTDLRRLAVCPARSSKKKLSRHMAKKIAFEGGDTDGATKLRREDLVRNANGRIVSKKASENAKKRYADGIGKWSACVSKARQELGLKGFVSIKKGTEIYEKAAEHYRVACAAAPKKPRT
eukprot:TRINITY_DN48941_c0_g1_i1.p1 TRINITY_DN48941_c0_g1~~TRINITY_DN48941_c0_g1_i1.p1  ORF type:complete len:627 (+),score=134.65 TRINITY_DN48941_c0_g1_i1:255-1883(+)